MSINLFGRRVHLKTLVFNVATFAAMSGGVLPPSKTAMGLVLGANVVLRALTKGPLVVLADAGRDQ